MAAVFDFAHGLLTCENEKKDLAAQLKQLKRRGLCPKGGFADVGRHTGFRQRDTCWPLVVGVCKALITRNHEFASSGSFHFDCFDFFDFLMGRCFLWLAEQHLSVITQQSSTSTPSTVQIDAVMRLISNAVQTGVILAEAGYNMQQFQVLCTQARKQLDKTVAARNDAYAREFTLAADLHVEYEKLQITLPAPQASGAAGASMEEKRTRANLNIGWLPLLFHDGSSLPLFVAVQAWLSHPKIYSASDSCTMLLVLETLDMLFNKYALSLASPTPTLQTDEERNALEWVVEKYRTTMATFLNMLVVLEAGHDSRARLRGGLLSSKLLVVWVVQFST